VPASALEALEVLEVLVRGVGAEAAAPLPASGGGDTMITPASAG
jgi:hypothetical protein